MGDKGDLNRNQGRQSKKEAANKFMSTTEIQRQVLQALVPPKNRVYHLSRASNRCLTLDTQFRIIKKYVINM